MTSVGQHDLWIKVLNKGYLVISITLQGSCFPVRSHMLIAINGYSLYNRKLVNKEVSSVCNVTFDNYVSPLSLSYSPSIFFQ